MNLSQTDLNNLIFNKLRICGMTGLKQRKFILLEGKMSEENNIEVFAKIEEDTRNSLSGDMLGNALDLLAYLKESGRTWMYHSAIHPEFYYMGELTCLLAYSKFYEKLGQYDQSPSWNICCWQHENDIYELDSFPVDESVKEFAWAKVWKCFNCGGCDNPGGGCRRIFGKEYDGVCCNVFQFVNPDNEELEKIKKLMELQKRIIADSKKK